MCGSGSPKGRSGASPFSIVSLHAVPKPRPCTSTDSPTAAAVGLTDSSGPTQLALAAAAGIAAPKPTTPSAIASIDARWRRGPVTTLGRSGRAPVPDQPRLRRRSRRRAFQPVAPAASSRSARSASMSGSSSGASVGADDPAEQQVGERRVAGEHRTVQVGADDPLAQHAVDVADAVAAAAQHPAERPLAGPERRAAAVVLEPGEHRQAEARVGLDHAPRRSAGSARPRSPCRRARARRAVAVARLVGVAEQLEARRTPRRRPRRRRARGRSRAATRACRPRPSPGGRPRRRRRGRRRASRGSASPAGTSTSSASMPRRRHRSTRTTALPRSP